MLYNPIAGSRRVETCRHLLVLLPGITISCLACRQQLSRHKAFRQEQARERRLRKMQQKKHIPRVLARWLPPTLAAKKLQCSLSAACESGGRQWDRSGLGGRLEHHYA